MDDILTPMERSVKAYLTSTMSKDLIELMSLMAVERPEDPHFWLASKLLERSPNGPYVAVARSAMMGGRKPAGASPGPAQPPQ